MTAPARFDDTFVAGDTYDLVINTKQTVEGGVAILHIRTRPEQPPLVVANAITLAEGKITFKLTPAETRKLDTTKGSSQNCVYQVQFTGVDGNVSTLLTGHFRVLRDLAK